MKRFDVVSALFLLLFGLLAGLEARSLSLGTLGKPEPGFFPFYLGLLLALLALGLLARAFWGGHAEAAIAREATQRLQWWKVLATLAALLVYAFLLEPLGFVGTTALLMLFLFRFVEPRPWPVALGGCAATALAAYVLFKVWLGVQLPVGTWFR